MKKCYLENVCNGVARKHSWMQEVTTGMRQRRKITYHLSSLRRIFEPKRDENGEWIRLYNEELHSLYRSPNNFVFKSRTLRWAAHIARMEEGRSAFKILTDIPTENRHLGRPRHRWESNIIMELR